MFKLSLSDDDKWPCQLVQRVDRSNQPVSMADYWSVFPSQPFFPKKLKKLVCPEIIENPEFNGGYHSIGKNMDLISRTVWFVKRAATGSVCAEMLLWSNQWSAQLWTLVNWLEWLFIRVISLFDFEFAFCAGSWWTMLMNYACLAWTG